MSDDIKIGQVWQELDNRPGCAHRRVVRGFADDGRVILGYESRHISSVTKAKRSRFNGKTGGYQLVRDVSP